MLVHWNPQDPWRDIRAIQHQMDGIFADLLPISRKRTQVARPAIDGPAFNVADLGDKYLIEAELPGVSEDALSIDATSHGLTVHGKREVEAPEGYTSHRIERSDLEFSRSFKFKTKLDLEHVTARLQQGILRIELAKQAAEQPRTISVTAG